MNTEKNTENQTPEKQNQIDELLSAMEEKAEESLASHDENLDEKIPSIDEILAELNTRAEKELPTTNQSAPEKNQEQEAYESSLIIHWGKLEQTAQTVKKAIRSINWRSFKQLSNPEKDELCAEINNILWTTKKMIVGERPVDAEGKKQMLHSINSAILKIQIIADDKKIKIPQE
jgi:hypothetical protein